MSPAVEVSANVLNATSIVLAGRNSLHTWWTGIAGCALFGWVFVDARLYADATLQLFFIGASVAGYLRWRRGASGHVVPVRHLPPLHLLPMALCAVAVASGYAWLLARFTDAAAPLPDSVVLSFSVLGQFLLVARRVESWWCWLVVNSVAVPLYLSRGLHVTAALYVAFWLNAWVSLFHWRRLAAQPTPAPVAAVP